MTVSRKCPLDGDFLVPCKAIVARTDCLAVNELHSLDGFGARIFGPNGA